MQLLNQLMLVTILIMILQQLSNQSPFFLWVEADLITDLDIVSLLNNQNDVPPTALPRSLSKRQSLG